MELNDIKYKLNEFLKKHNKDDIEIEFIEDEKEQKFEMKAEVTENAIKIYPQNIKESYIREGFKISLLDYYIIVLCHEIGHFLDESFNYEEIVRDLNNIKNIYERNSIINSNIAAINSIIIKEINAMEYGKRYVPQELESYYKKMNELNTRSYWTKLSNAIKLVLESIEVSDFLEKLNPRVRECLLSYSLDNLS